MSDELLDVFRGVFKNPDLEITDDLTADDIKDWDSLRHISLINAVEEKFGIRFKNSELVRMRCIGDLRALVKIHEAAKNA